MLMLGISGCAAPSPPRPPPTPDDVDAALALAASAPLAPSARPLPALSPGHPVRIAEPRSGHRTTLRSGRRVDIEIHRADLGNALQLLANEARMNLVLGEGISGEVSLSLRRADPAEALQALAASRGLSLLPQGNILVVQRMQGASR